VLDKRGAAASTGDVLSIDNTGDPSSITGTLDTIHTALQQLDSDGRIVLYGGSSPEAVLPETPSARRTWAARRCSTRSRVRR